MFRRENYGCEVVCFTGDVGQVSSLRNEHFFLCVAFFNFSTSKYACYGFEMKGIKELDGLEEKAKASGASQLVVKDLTEEFVKDYIFPCLRAGAIYERKYLLGTSMARPVIAKVTFRDLVKEAKIHVLKFILTNTTCKMI